MAKRSIKHPQFGIPNGGLGLIMKFNGCNYSYNHNIIKAVQFCKVSYVLSYKKILQKLEFISDKLCLYILYPKFLQRSI